MRAVGIVQARMRSRRLPGKVLMPMAGAPLLQRLLERVDEANRLDALAVATSTSIADDAIETLCRTMDLPCFRGSEEDVLNRVWQAARALGAGILVRLTGDNPLVNGELIDWLVAAFTSADPPVAWAMSAEDAGFPIGLTAEAVSMSALAQALDSDDPADREHVTWYVRRQPERFRQLLPAAPYCFPPARLTIDTRDDYNRVRALFERLHAGHPRFGLAAIAAALAADQIDLA